MLAKSLKAGTAVHLPLHRWMPLNGSVTSKSRAFSDGSAIPSVQFICPHVSGLTAAFQTGNAAFGETDRSELLAISLETQSKLVTNPGQDRE